MRLDDLVRAIQQHRGNLYVEVSSRRADAPRPGCLEVALNKTALVHELRRMFAPGQETGFTLRPVGGLTRFASA